MNTDNNEMKNEMTLAAMLDIRERIAKLDNVVVTHPAMSAALTGLQECIDWSTFSKEPMGAVLVGTGGMGKTTICDMLVKSFPEQQVRTESSSVRTVPAFYSSIPSPSTIKSVAANLLESLGDPFPKKGSANVLTTRLYELLKRCKTKVILLDEFHHLLLEGSINEKRTHKICNWLKSLINNTGVMVCLIGTPACEALVNFDSQMSRRFMHRFHLTPLKAGTSSSPGALGGFLRTLSQKYAKVLGLDGMPDFTQHFHIQQFEAATSGNTAFILALLKKAIAIALIGRRTKVDIEDFATAFDTGITASISEVKGNPFRMSPQQLATHASKKKLKGDTAC